MNGTGPVSWRAGDDFQPGNTLGGPARQRLLLILKNNSNNGNASSDLDLPQVDCDAPESATKLRKKTKKRTLRKSTSDSTVVNPAF